MDRGAECRIAGASAAPPPPDRLLADVVLRAGLFRGEAERALLSRLSVAPDDRILELGVGSGRLLAAVAARATRGRVVGVDPSAAMLRHALRRNARFVSDGRVELRAGSSRDLAALGAGVFDKVYGVHVTLFWDDPAHHLREIRRVLRPGGLLVLGTWPDEAPRTRGGALEDALAEAGYRDVRSARVREEEGSGALAWSSARRPFDAGWGS